MIAYIAMHLHTRMQMMGQGMTADTDVSADVMGAVCAHKSWDKVVPLLKALQVCNTRARVCTALVHTYVLAWCTSVYCLGARVCAVLVPAGHTAHQCGSTAVSGRLRQLRHFVS